VVDNEDLEEIHGERLPEGIFAFPKGVRAGTFLHDIFEHLDFTEQDRDVIRDLVAGKLIQYGFGLTWTDTICEMIAKVLGAPLNKESPDLRLSAIEKKDRLNELEFYFPLKMISPRRLKEIMTANLGDHFSGYVPEALGRLRFTPVRGFMRGFMDLVFTWGGRYYLLDWKSNFLGVRIEDYDRESLAMAMDRESYVLQYIIYTIALDQYLRLRQPGYRYEKDFGGVFYIFLRGVDPGVGPDFGIYRDMPSPELINTLREELIG
jgi:exodeoxyribonuclease V beta subunit